MSGTSIVNNIPNIISHTVEVVDVQWRSETYVSSSSTGGGGMVYGGTGYISAGSTQVSSNTHSWQQVIIRYHDGRESSISLAKDFTLRPGHVLHTCWIGEPTDDTLYLAYVVNTNTDEATSVTIPKALMPKTPTTLKLKAVGAVLLALCALGIPGIGIFASIGVFYMLSQKYRAERARLSAEQAQLEELVINASPA